MTKKMEKLEKLEKKNCSLNQHYWESTGVYQQEWDKLYNDLVPASGDAPTIQGELIRCISRLYYDYCNNGNCNALDITMEDCNECNGSGYEEDSDGETQDCQWCGGDCNVEGDAYITDYYKEMIDFLKEYLIEKELVSQLENWMVNDYSPRYSFSDEQMNLYDKVTDAVVYQCLTTENKPNPKFKK
jgi:hypothetical protein